MGIFYELVGMILGLGSVIVTMAVAWGKITSRLTSNEEHQAQTDERAEQRHTEARMNDRELYGRDETHGERLATLEERTKSM